MKIQRTNPYIQIYSNQQHAKKTTNKSNIKDDQLNISNEALSLQKNGPSVERQQYVEQIKSLVQSGEYKVDFNKTAEKMIEFWSRNR